MACCAFWHDIIEEGLDSGDLIAACAADRLLDQPDDPRPSYDKRKKDLERWLAEPLDPNFVELPTDGLLERFRGASAEQRDKIAAVLKRRAYADPAVIDALTAALRDNDVDTRFRMRACLYVVWKMLRLAASLQSEDLKKQAERLEKEGKRHREQASGYNSEASAQENQADDLDKAGKAEEAKKLREAAAKTRERERKANRREREADADRAEAEDDQEEAAADESADDEKVKDRQQRKEAREARRKERDGRRNKRAEEAQKDRKEDNAD